MGATKRDTLWCMTRKRRSRGFACNQSNELIIHPGLLHLELVSLGCSVSIVRDVQLR
ncbi:hypothetical protein Brsp05_00574 [Brucella sp. NBRC 12953]|jgi:hypothetical protein